MSEKEQGSSPIDGQMAAPPVAYEAELRGGPENGEEVVASSGDSASDMVQSRAAVLAILFLVTGALGIPLLWMNQKFSTLERVMWSVIVTLYTIALIAVAWMIVMWSYRQIFG